MRILEELLAGTYVLELPRSQDRRGFFVKTFQESMLRAVGLSFDLKEEFYSASLRDVIRGMHFQVPPHDHQKLVYCVAGEVDDVLVDLRPGTGYGRVAHARLCAEQPRLLFIPSGIAHGFRSLSDDSVLVYKTSAEYAPAFDHGVRWDSIGFDWGIKQPVVSDRDSAFPLLKELPKFFR